MTKEDSEPKEKGFLRTHFEFAGTMLLHPIKTTKNVIAAIQEAPMFTAEKVVFGASTAFGAAALVVGAASLDPLLSVIGATFLSIGANRLNARGEVARTALHAANVEAEPVEAEEATAEEPKAEEKTTVEKLDEVLGKDENAPKGGFKPNLAQFKTPGSVIDGGP